MRAVQLLQSISVGRREGRGGEKEPCLEEGGTNRHVAAIRTVEIIEKKERKKPEKKRGRARSLSHRRHRVGPTT